MPKPIIKKVAISIPSEGHTLPEAYDNHLVNAFQAGIWQERMEQEKRPVQYQFYWYTTGRLLTQMAREKMIRVARDGGMDYIIQFDDDMVLPPNFIKDMVLAMEEKPEMSVMGALAFMRTAPHYPVIYQAIEGYDGTRRQEYYINQNVKRYPKDTILECDAVGFGGVIIDMNFVRNKMREPYFMSTTQTGEDIWFCVQVKEAGGRVFMNTKIKLGHIMNPQIIDEEGFEKWVKENGHDLGEELPSKYISNDR